MKIYHVSIIFWLLIAVNCTSTDKFDIRQKHFERRDECYVYFNIKYGNSYYTMVSTANMLSNLTSEYTFNRSLTDSEFQFYLDTTLFKKGHFTANDSVYYWLEYYDVNPQLIKLYDTIDIINLFNLENIGVLPDSIDFENEKAIIYMLLSKNLMRCCANDESGRTVFIDLDTNEVKMLNLITALEDSFILPIF